MKAVLALLAILNAATALGQSSPIGWGPGPNAVPLSSVVSLFMPNQKTVRLGTNNVTNYVELKAPTGMGGNLTWIFPPTAGTANYVLRTDGAGALTWVQGSSTITGSVDAMAGFDDTGNLYSVPGYQFNPSTDPALYGENFAHIVTPTIGGGNHLFNSENLQLNPAAPSNNDSWTHADVTTALGADDSGFTLGANSTVRALNVNTLAINKSDVGSIQQFSSGVTLGNGTDALTFGNISGINQQVQLNSPSAVTTFNGIAATMNAPAGSTVGSYSGISDFAQIDHLTGPFAGISEGSQIVTADNNFNIISDNTQIVTANDGVNSLNVGPIITTLAGANGYNGLTIHPTITTVTNPAVLIAGIDVSMNNVDPTHTNQKAINVSSGNVDIGNGNLSVQGHLTANASNTIVSGGGTPSSSQLIISGMDIPASATVTNSDFIGLNTSALITIGANSTTTAGPFGLGLNALAIPSVVEIHSGATIDSINAATYVVALSPSNDGGTIDTLRLTRTAAIPEGGTQTINKLQAFVFDLPFGDPATQTWGLYFSPASAQNWLKSSLKIGGSSGSTDVVSNADTGLEVEGKAVLPKPMTNTVRDTLTGLQGMLINSSTDNKLERFDGSQWRQVATGPNVASGVFTPTATCDANCTVSNVYDVQWSQVGTTVTVSGVVDLSITLAVSTTTEFHLTVPVASVFTTTKQLAGVATDGGLGLAAPDSVRCLADLGNGQADCAFAAFGTGTRTFSYTYTYQVL